MVIATAVDLMREVKAMGRNRSSSRVAWIFFPIRVAVVCIAADARNRGQRVAGRVAWIPGLVRH
jgi:hypothetical protein